MLELKSPGCPVVNIKATVSRQKLQAREKSLIYPKINVVMSLVESVVTRTGISVVVTRTGVSAVVSRTGVNAVVTRTGVSAVVSRTGVSEVVTRTGVSAVVSRTSVSAVVTRTGVSAVVSRTGVSEVVTVSVEIDSETDSRQCHWNTIVKMTSKRSSSCTLNSRVLSCLRRSSLNLSLAPQKLKTLLL